MKCPYPGLAHDGEVHYQCLVCGEHWFAAIVCPRCRERDADLSITEAEARVLQMDVWEAAAKAGQLEEEA